MAKRRKTREQKKLADLRHTFTHTLAKSTYSKAKIKIEIKENQEILERNKTVITLNEYPFLIKDLSKTGALTALILGFQIILFFLLKNHILIIPKLSY